MDLNQLKIELIQKIISCEDENLLRKIEQILDENPSEVKEGEKDSVKTYPEFEPEFSHEQEERIHSISEEQEEELMRRYQNHLEEDGKTFSWEDARKNLHETYDF